MQVPLAVVAPDEQEEGRLSRQGHRPGQLSLFAKQASTAEVQSVLFLRGLTLWQPWAWAVIHAGKDIENRLWAPPRDAIGCWTAIHASSRFDGPYEAQSRAQIESRAGVRVPGPERLERGVILGLARLVGEVEATCSSPWYAGPGTPAEPNHGWRFLEPIPLERPFRCPGARGLWPLPFWAMSQVLDQVDQGRLFGRRACPGP